jgi:hypothetical protein
MWQILPNICLFLVMKNFKNGRNTFWYAEILIFLQYFTEKALTCYQNNNLTSYQNSPKNPQIPQRLKNPQICVVRGKIP